MVFILGASSLDHALRKLSAPSQKRVKETCFTKPGLSFNFNARDSQKTIQYYLHHFLSNRKDLVIWHDAINNSISKHRSNNNRSLSTDQLKEPFFEIQGEYYRFCILSPQRYGQYRKRAEKDRYSRS